MRKIAYAMMLFLLVAGVANAAVVTWSTASIMGANDVINIGTTVEAINGVGGSVTTSPTVNGVTFTANGSLLSNSYTGDSWTNAVDDLAYESLLSTIDYQGNGTGPLTVKTFTGLTIGQQYLFQYWYADYNWAAPNPDRYITVALGSDTQSGDNQISGLEFAVGTFTADADEIDLIVTSTQNGARLTAYQLRAIPEPATMGLVALFGGGIVFIRRFMQI